MAGPSARKKNQGEEEENNKGIFSILRFNPCWHEQTECHVSKNGHVMVPRRQKWQL
jgi:hypothetical protein